MGGDRRAVVELGILADLEGDRLAVGRHGIALGQLGLDLAVVEGQRAVGQLLAAEGDQAVVHVPGGDIGAEAGADTMDVHAVRSEEHTSELPSLMRISYAV